MLFKGQLLLPEDPGPGLRVNLDLAEHHLAVESDGGGLGAWPLEVVNVERRGDVFSLTVAGESLEFVADDTIAFAYTGVPTIERFSGRHHTRYSFRSFLNRIWNGPDETPPSPAREPSTDPAPREELSHDLEDTESLPPATKPDLRSDAIAEISDPLVDLEAMMGDGEISIPSNRVDEPIPVDDRIDFPGCPAIRSDGRRCESPILTSSGYCYPHDPKRAFKDKYQEALAARAQLKQDATGRLNRIYSRLDKAMRQVERGELDPETATAMAQIANTMCAILGMEDPATGDSR